jgi:hypothetical protein
VIAVVHDNVIEMVDLRGHPKTTKKIGLSKFEFDFKVEGMGKKNSFIQNKNDLATISFIFQLLYKMTAFLHSIYTACKEGL